jgi:hypothetical protein
VNIQLQERDMQDTKVIRQWLVTTVEYYRPDGTRVHTTEEKPLLAEESAKIEWVMQEGARHYNLRVLPNGQMVLDPVNWQQKALPYNQQAPQQIAPPAPRRR